MKTLLTGDAGSGKTARVLREFRAANPASDTRIVVPTATLETHLRNELARDGLVFAPRRVQTFAQFLKDLTAGTEMVSEPLYRTAVEAAVRAVRPPEFQNVADLPGFPKRLARTLSNLDAAGCTPAHLRRLRSSVAPYAGALAALWDRVQSELCARNLETRGECLLRVAAAGCQFPAQIWFDGFSRLSPPEISFIIAAAERSDVTLVLPDDGVEQDLREHLAANGFVEERLPGGRSVAPVLVVPETPERECDEIARGMLNRHRAGVSFREMGVILRKPDAYAPLLRAAFERFGIPARFYFSRPLALHPAGRLFGGIVDALLGGWQHEETLGLLRLVPYTGISAALDAFEIEIRKRLPGRGLAALLQLAGTRRVLARPLQDLMRLEDWAQIRLAPDEWTARLATLPALFAPRLIPDEVPRSMVADFRSRADGCRAFTETVAQAAQWWSENAAPLTLAEFWGVVGPAVREAKIQSEPRARETAHVISAFEARQWDLDVVFIPGLIEQQFPAQNERDPFLSDLALRDLEKEGVSIRTAARKDDEEQELFASAVKRARAEVILSYPLMDARGQRVLPSIFLKDFIAAGAAERPRDVVQPALPDPVAPYSRASRMMNVPVLNELTGRHASLSVSSLESLLQCPFQFFAGRTLRIREMPRAPEDRVDFLIPGNIAHEVLSAWWGTGEPIEPIFNRVFSAQAEKENLQPGFRTELSRRAILAALRRFAEDAQYPRTFGARLEQKFEMAIDGDLTITGRFDRIDVLGDGRAVVLDYKYSTGANTKDRIDDETRLQGPLYALALREKFGLAADAVLYVSLKGGKPAYYGWGQPPAESELRNLAFMAPGWIDDALARTRSAVAAFRQGAIQPRPANLENCRFCAVRDACRFEVAGGVISISAAVAP